MLVYVASPLDGPHADRAKALKSEAVSLLHGKQIATYDPSKPFGRGDLEPLAVVSLNELALDKCDGMIAILPDGCSSIGVPMEILTAHRHLKMPTAVVGAGWSVQLRGLGISAFDPESGAGKAVDWLERRMSAPSGLAVDKTISALAKALRGVRGEDYPSAPLDGPHPLEGPKGTMDDLIEYGIVRAINYTGEEDCEPRRVYDGDAGFDLFCSERTNVPYGGFADVPCGVSVELPSGVWAMITGRSSTLRKRKLLVSQGIIDNEYRGPLFAGCWNLSDKSATVERGERIAQLIPFHQASADLVMKRVEELPLSERGEKGFGSTGG